MLNKRAFLYGFVFIIVLFMTVSSGYAEEEDVYGITFGSSGTFAELHGFVNVRYKDFENEKSTFDTHQFYLSAIAKIHPRVSVFGEVEYEHVGKDVQPYLTTTSDGTNLTSATLSNPKQKIMVDRAFIDWQVMDDGLLTARFGTFNPPIGQELSEYYAPARKFESRPQFVDEVLVHEWVDTGIEFFGKYLIGPVALGYDLSLVNGTRDLYHKATPKGALQNNDNNSDRTFIGRLSVSPAVYYGGLLEAGISTARGNYNDSGTPEMQLKIIDFDIRWVTDTIDLRGEYAKGSSDDTPTFKGDSAGYYVQAAYKFIKNMPSVKYLEGIVRYDSTDISGAASKGYDEQSIITAGVNYSPYSSFLMRAEYQIKDRNMLVGNEVDNNGFMLTAVVDF